MITEEAIKAIRDRFFNAGEDIDTLIKEIRGLNYNLAKANATIKKQNDQIKALTQKDKDIPISLKEERWLCPKCSGRNYGFYNNSCDKCLAPNPYKPLDCSSETCICGHNKMFHYYDSYTQDLVCRDCTCESYKVKSEDADEEADNEECHCGHRFSEHVSGDMGDCCGGVCRCKLKSEELCVCGHNRFKHELVDDT